MLSTLKQTLRLRFQTWLNRRLPPMRSITLDQSRIFIFPSRAGFYFVGVLGIILVAAINYQNNMVFAMVFLLVSAFIVTILHTFANLAGLSIAAVRSSPAFAGEAVRFDLKISRETGRCYYDIGLSWPNSERVNISLTEMSELIVQLHLPAVRRGLLTPDRLLVETFYPLGLLRCWTWLALDIEALVYPRSIEGPFNPGTGTGGGESENPVSESAGSDDFYAFKNYQPGDPLKHIAWKSYAKGQPLTTKQFAAYQDRLMWLDWENFVGDRETRLSALCYWVLKLEKAGRDYGLRLPGTCVDPGNGESHRDRALRELALFEIDR